MKRTINVLIFALLLLTLSSCTMFKKETDTRYDITTETIVCAVDETQTDTKETWKVKSPVETPDKYWTVESVDGRVVTYSKIICDHVKIIDEDTPCEIDPEDTDYYRTRIVREELYNAEYKYEEWGELISSENGILTFYEGRVCPMKHWCVQKMGFQTRCQLNPWLELWDNEFEMQIHTSSGFVPDSSWKYRGESADGEWIYYTRAVCPKNHKAYADQSPEPGASTDYIYESQRCAIDGTRWDMLMTWEVYMPTESPDPSWIVIDDDGAVVTYGMLICDHETPVPEADIDTEITDDAAAEPTPAPEG